MMHKVTAMLVILMAFAVLAGATDMIAKQPMQKTKRTDLKVQLPSTEKASFAGELRSDMGLAKSGALRKTAAATHLQVGVSGNGYGWLNREQRSIGRFAGNDFDTGVPIDFLLVGFRGHGDGNADMAVGEINLESGLSNGTLTLYEGASSLNAAISPYGSGARYPCVVAAERPLICFNQYVGDVTVPTDPARSHPYMITDYGTYGNNGGAWSTPDFLMDDGWVNPTVATMPTAENRLWNGPVDVARDANGTYHYVGVYETWYSDLEIQLYGVGNEKHILTATSAGSDPSWGWTKGWEETPPNNPTWIDTNLVQIYRTAVDINSNGFGAIIGPGHLGHSDSQLDYYYEHTRICYSTTNDYGVTWTAWDTVSMTAMGFPGYIRGSDKMIISNIVGTDTTWYDGPAFVGNNFDMSLMVDESGYIYVGFSSLWGSKSADGSGWYPNYNYSGIFIAKSVDGGANWGAGRIALNNGIYVGDDDLGVSPYFFDNETQISMDDQGNLYATWLDRRRTGTQISTFQKYTDPEDATGYTDYKTDIYASHSIDGGNSWSDPINLTDTPSLDEYELNMALKSRNQNAATEGNYGRIWVGYVLADTASGNPATDALIELSNDVWVAEAQGFNSPAAIDDKPVQVAGQYALRQNYPNPFNPTTRIEVVPLQSGHAVVDVFTVTGQKVRNLFDGQVTRGNAFSVDFDASDLAAGVYVYRLTNGKHVEVKKMALIK